MLLNPPTAAGGTTGSGTGSAIDAIGVSSCNDGSAASAGGADSGAGASGGAATADSDNSCSISSSCSSSICKLEDNLN